jgi:hypothetical protein
MIQVAEMISRQIIRTSVTAGRASTCKATGRKISTATKASNKNNVPILLLSQIPIAMKDPVFALILRPGARKVNLISQAGKGLKARIQSLSRI